MRKKLRNLGTGKRLMVSILAIALCVLCADFALGKMDKMEAEAAVAMKDEIELLTGTLVYKDAYLDSGETSHTTYNFNVKFDDEHVEKITGSHSEYMELEVGQRIEVYKYRDCYALNEVAIVRQNINSLPWFMLAVFAEAGVLVLFIYCIYLIKRMRKKV